MKLTETDFTIAIKNLPRAFKPRTENAVYEVLVSGLRQKEVAIKYEMHPPQLHRAIQLY